MGRNNKIKIKEQVISQDCDNEISIISLLDGKRLLLKKNKPLGEGLFGSVYTLKSNGRATPYACKEIKLEHPKGQGYCNFSPYRRSYRFFEAIHDINGLYTHSLLVGYELKNDVFYIVMIKINGNTLEHAVKKKSNLDSKERYYAAFKELQAFHRKGYVHLDPHPGNFIISHQKPYEAKLIDLSKMQPISYGGSIYDYLIFERNLPASFSLTNFYLREKKEYFHKYPIAAISGVLNWLLFAALLVGIIPSLDDARMRARLLFSCFMYELVRSVNLCRSMGPNIFGLLSMVLLFLPIFLPLSDGPVLLRQEDVFNPWAFINTLYLYIGVSLASRLMIEFEADYILPEQIITKKMSLFFNHTHPLKENMLKKMKEISGTERFLPVSYAKQAGMFFKQAPMMIDKPCSNEVRPRF